MRSGPSVAPRAKRPKLSAVRFGWCPSRIDHAARYRSEPTPDARSGLRIGPGTGPVGVRRRPHKGSGLISRLIAWGHPDTPGSTARQDLTLGSSRRVPGCSISRSAGRSGTAFRLTHSRSIPPRLLLGPPRLGRPMRTTLTLPSSSGLRSAPSTSLPNPGGSSHTSTP